MTRRIIALVTIVFALGAAGPLTAPEAAAGSSQVIADCYAHSSLTQHYSVTALRAALGTMPADVKEYTDCYDVITHQLYTQLGGVPPAGSISHPRATSSGSFLPVPVVTVLAVLAVVAAGFGALAVRRRR